MNTSGCFYTALFNVKPINEDNPIGDAFGAFVNVLSCSTSKEIFLQNVESHLNQIGLGLVDYEDYTQMDDLDGIDLGDYFLTDQELLLDQVYLATIHSYDGD